MSDAEIIKEAMDRLVYQNDNCRIFHCNKEYHFIWVKATMQTPDNSKVWSLVAEPFRNEVHQKDAWLIYLRK